MGCGHGCWRPSSFSPCGGTASAPDLSLGPWGCRAVLARAWWCGPNPASLASEVRAMWNDMELLEAVLGVSAPSGGLAL